MSEQATIALNSMKRSLAGWLTYRRALDAYVAGKRPAASTARAPLPPRVVAVTLARDRFAREQDLAETIYTLLVESGCPASSLPAANVTVNPNAAADLAAIAIQGACTPQAQGIFPILFLVVPVGALVLVISQYLKSKADVAKEKERLLCIQSGACTDSGFWLKMAAISVIGWLAWDKMGLGEKLKGTFKKK